MPQSDASAIAGGNVMPSKDASTTAESSPSSLMRPARQRPKLWPNPPASFLSGPVQLSSAAGLAVPQPQNSSHPSSAISSASALSSSSLPPSSPNSSHSNSSRIGAQFQASLPSGLKARAAWSSSSSVVAPEDPLYSIEGSCVYRGGSANHLLTERQIDQYLHSIRTLFVEDPSDYDEESALKFLHSCDYDDKLALSMLSPTGIRGNHQTNSTPPRSPIVDGSSASDAHGGDDGDMELEDSETADWCCVCNDGGDLVICDHPGCKRVYHGTCTYLDVIPPGTWECPRHYCSHCRSKQQERLVHCAHCPTSYCINHLPSDLESAPDSPVSTPVLPSSVDSSNRNRLSSPVAPFYCTLCSDRKRRFERIAALNLAQRTLDQSSSNPDQQVDAGLINLLRAFVSERSDSGSASLSMNNEQEKTDKIMQWANSLSASSPQSKSFSTS